jgi:predicted secreted Zn-dependent protease
MTLIIAPTFRHDYDVSAPDLQGVVDLFAPEDEAGSCEWQTAYEFGGVRRDGRPSDLIVEVAIDLRLPRWVQRDGASRAEQAEWDRFLAALSAHEDGHERILRDGAQALHDHLARAQVSRLPAVFAEQTARAQTQSDAYDATTDHGRNPPPGTIITVP